MNAQTHLKPVSITGFNGLYNRGKLDTCPPDHLTDCFNCIFPGKSQIDLREPTTVQSTGTGSTISFAVGNVLGGAVLLTLASNGNFYDETHNATLLATIGTVGAHPDDFQALNIFGRVYITFTLQAKALVGGSTYCYYYSTVRTAYVFETIAGIAPTVAPTLAQVNAGVVDIGVHGVAYCWVSDRGFVSPPSPVTNIPSLGGQDIEVSFTATAPANCQYVLLLMTLANQLTLYFVPGGGTYAAFPGIAHLYNLVINIYDTSLISSADYLNDIYTSVPSASSLSFYHGRLVLTGQDPSPDDILISNQADPETFNLVNNIVQLPADYGVNTSNGSFSIRDVLYVTKPNGTYSIQDNGGVPSTWGVTSIDTGIGAFSPGISTFASVMSGSDVLDTCLICNERGLMLFDGAYGALPLTYKIETIWRTIDPQYFYRVQIAHDVWLKRIYVAMPLVPSLVTPTFTSQASNFMILMGDYQEGLNPQTIKWSVWTTGSAATITKISVESFTLTYTVPPAMIYQLAICNGAGKIFKIVPNGTNPDVNGAGAYVYTINQIITTGPTISSSGGVNTYLMLDFSIYGLGSMNLSVYGNNRSPNASYLGFNLSAYNNAISGNATSISNANPGIVNFPAHGLFSNQWVTMSGATGSWLPVNGSFIITVIDSAHFSIPIDTSTFGAYGAQVVNVFHPALSPNLQRMINFSSEVLYIRLQCDQTIPSGVQGRVNINQIDVYLKNMWLMRPALAIRA